MKPNIKHLTEPDFWERTAKGRQAQIDKLCDDRALLTEGLLRIGKALHIEGELVTLTPHQMIDRLEREVGFYVQAVAIADNIVKTTARNILRELEGR